MRRQSEKTKIRDGFGRFLLGVRSTLPLHDIVNAEHLAYTIPSGDHPIHKNGFSKIDR